MLLLGAVKICITGAALRWPGGYWRRRFWAQPSARILFYSIPSCRSLRVSE